MPMPQLRLVLQAIEAPEAAAGPVRERALRSLIEALVSAELWAWPIQTWAKGKDGTKRPKRSLEHVMEDLDRRIGSGLVLGDSAAGATEVEIYKRGSNTVVICSCALGSSPQADLLGRLVDIAGGVWNAIRDEATIGPGFSIRPVNLDRPRPLPPRIDGFWIPGDAAYFLSHTYHRDGFGGDIEGVAKLRAAKLPDGILRDELPELTVIRCEGPAEDTAAFARQLYALEVWLASVLALPVASNYRETGDEQVPVFSKENAEPFTFYDASTATAYKAIPVLQADDFDEEARRELKKLLAKRATAGGVEVRHVMIVFPTREAALSVLDDVVALGAEGAVYIEEDGSLWNPKPKGNWIRTAAEAG